ncbi:GNAT family N-acetyltransferase [Actinokineospora auranticolor]|uniref:N-acetyltransferase domain-containing protein n=1 Tax=Actinokineospora auranticolor TaxID=155976 RepID=A0A2S6GKH8_9PSEU|nr:GNAT family N-acetyltransferase [Actinokineospora auranticolor]PPK65693.1 hypothetical protein CLV40_113177 [Actinokineospora auranticolor]
MAGGDFEIGSASADEVRLIAEWAAEERWNPGLADPAAFAPADPGGFLVGRLGGEPIACISAIRYGAGFGFIGYYIARPRWRGQGFGIQVWRAGMARLSGRLVGLDGVVDQQDNYRESGFARAWNNVRYEGVLPVSDVEGSAGDPVAIVDARSVAFDRIAGYDRKFFPEARDAFLAGWVGLGGRTARVAVRDGELCGFAVRRDSRAASRVGPLYADSPGVAAALLRAVSDGGPLAVDVPDANAAATRLMADLGFAPTFEAARMYTGPAPAVDLAGVYGVTSLELG